MFSMARFDRDPSLVFQVYFYEESVFTKPISLFGKSGVVIELQSHYSVQRALNDGWIDVTKELKALAETPKIELPKEAEKVSKIDDEEEVIIEKPKKKTKKRSTTRRK